jgi:hypothetical protein
MVKRGIATFTLDSGTCPRWLFERMVKLGREMARVIVAEEGPDEFIKRIGDPVWFQSLGTVLAFDWNASGLTTILTAALKDAIRGQERELGIFICGGKGKTSRKVPDEINNWSNKLSLEEKNSKRLVYNSRMAAKVDSALIQDGFDIYHHSFFFTKNGAWAVVQQGMNTKNQTARRYHWHSLKAKDLISEPHSGISSRLILPRVLNMTAKQSDKNRNLSADLVTQNFNSLFKDIELLDKFAGPVSRMAKIKKGERQLTLLELDGVEFHHHPVELENFSRSSYLKKILWQLCDQKPENYEKLLATPGVGPKTIRALALVSEVIYGAQPSYQDPARYSFAHGGKDATPYPIDTETYDRTIEAMKRFVMKSKISQIEKTKIIRKIKNLKQN